MDQQGLLTDRTRRQKAVLSRRHADLVQSSSDRCSRGNGRQHKRRNAHASWRLALHAVSRTSAYPVRRTRSLAHPHTRCSLTRSMAPCAWSKRMSRARVSRALRSAERRRVTDRCDRWMSAWTSTETLVSLTLPWVFFSKPYDSPCRAVDILLQWFLFSILITCTCHNLSSTIRLADGSPPSVHHLTLSRFCWARCPAPFWWHPALFKKLKWRPALLTKKKKI